LLRIGPFSRLARVTLKTLRFYDAAGLFRPAWTDPRSGYRFYSAAQLPLLGRIRLLRDLGCSLAEIQQLTTSSPDGQPYRVGAHAPVYRMLRRRLMVGVALSEQRLRQLDALLAHEHPSGLPMRERRIAATAALTIRDCIRSGGSDIHRMFESAERQVARTGNRTRQNPFMLLHDMDYHRAHVDVEVCVPVRPEALGSAGVRLIEPVARAACVQFSGDYSQAPTLFDAALDSMHGSRARIAAPVREVYLRFGADQRGYKLDPRFLTDDVRQYRTEIQIPLRGIS
jgi:DNA-binding transcriptional MerR regulator